MQPGRDTPPEGHLRIGRLGRSFGLDGGLRFHPLGEAEANAVVGLARVFVAGLGAVDVTRVRPHAGGLIVYLAGVRRPEQAKPLANADVYAAPADLPPAGAGSGVAEGDPEGGPDALPYVGVLVGAPVRLDGAAYGEVVDLVPGPNPLLVIAGPGGEVLVPARAPYVRFRDVGSDAGRDAVDLVVDLVEPPEGLLEP